MPAEIINYYKLFELKRSDDLAAIQANLAKWKEAFGGIWDSDDDDEVGDQLYICLLEAEQVFSTEGNRAGYDRALDSVSAPPVAEVTTPESPAPKPDPEPAPQRAPPRTSQEISRSSTDLVAKPEPRQMSPGEELLVARLSKMRRQKENDAKKVRSLQRTRRHWRIFAMLFLIPAVHFYQAAYELHVQGDNNAATFPLGLAILSFFAFLGIMFRPPFAKDLGRAKESLKVSTRHVSDLEAKLAEERARG
ncbi:MAG: hypothetical protein Q4P33_08960 [Flaviflexus sp.]|nr:hypothetical protein [Flaviflexus sp.]